jgi:hypothetical protein
LALENAMRALLPPGSATIIDIDADEIQINQPGVFLQLGTGVNSVEIAGYFNTLPAKAINSAYVLNPRRVSDNLRVEIPLVKPAIDAALLASAVRANLSDKLALLDLAVSTRLAATDYTAPANDNITAIKVKTDTLMNADLSGLATHADVQALNTGLTPAQDAKLTEISTTTSNIMKELPMLM